MQREEIKTWLKPILKEIEITRGVFVSKDFFEIILTKLSADSNFTIIGSVVAEKWITVGKWPQSKKKLEISDFFPKKEDVEVNYAFQQELYQQFCQSEHTHLKQVYREAYEKKCKEHLDSVTPEEFKVLQEHNCEIYLELHRKGMEIEELKNQAKKDSESYDRVRKAGEKLFGEVEYYKSELQRTTANYNALLNSRIDDSDENFTFEEILDAESEY